jgi:hypothetical protein
MDVHSLFYVSLQNFSPAVGKRKIVMKTTIAVIVLYVEPCNHVGNAYYPNNDKDLWLLYF